MASHLTPGENVVNLYWDDLPDLFYSARRQRASALGAGAALGHRSR
jgi:hypothetical protein